MSTGRSKIIVILVGVFAVSLIFWVFIFFSFVLQDSESIAIEERNVEQLPPETNDPFVLGQYYFNQDDNPDGAYDLKEARKYFNEVIQEDPDGNNLVWYQLGRIDFIEGKFLSALYKFNKQIAYFDEKVPNVYYMIGLTYGYKARKSESEEDWRRAEEAFKTFIDIYGVSWASRVDLSWVYFAQGKFEEMLPLLEEVLPAFPNNPWLLNMYGLALMNTGDREGALKQFIIARAEAEKLTTYDWGKAYPGNDPAEWAQGLNEFRGAIEKNMGLLNGDTN